ncbi:NUDIX domain-containing protein [Vallicoccus soli]|uniref:8-oxo-dGTP diphosphatase n=1 Tax=Vallicoccus soli TaxID=2339232 RepID=A0A3A3YXY4_9ACTN|nr:NUDIX domain-containing protein [Vallicoccus soli]RJK94823.1 NUDIX domain-containing protein [Vallicoccus soli]
MQQVVVGLLVEDGRVLLALRSRARRAHPGRWALPGGHVEPGEAPGAALVRELHEELGITVLAHDPEPLHVLAPGLDAGGATALSVHRVRRWRGEPANLLPGEHDALRWCGSAALERLALAHPEHRALLLAAAGHGAAAG